MPDYRLQGNPSFAELAAVPAGAVPQRVLRPEIVPWAEMVTRLGQRNNRLEGLLVSRSRPAVGNIVRQLERERSRLARELHSGAGQPLAGIKLNLELLAKSREPLSESTLAILNRLERLTEQALQQIRAVSHSLHPPDWQQSSLGSALHSLIESSGLSSKVTVDFSLGSFSREPGQSVKIALYRCAQECISNIIRHSFATRVWIRVAEEGTREYPSAVVRIQDDGRGFQAGAGSRHGIGLIALKEYAEAAEGVVDIKSDSAGTTVLMSVPLMED